MRRSLRAQEKARGGGSQESRKKQRLNASASEDESDEERWGSDRGGSASESEPEALESEASDSADEWRPDERRKGGRKDRGQRGARHSSGDTEEDASDIQSQEDVEEDIDIDQHRGLQKRKRAAASRPDMKKKVPRIKDAKLPIPSGAELFPIGKPRENTKGAGAGVGVGASASSSSSLSMEQAGREAPEEEQKAAAQQQEDAKRMWEEIRARKAERSQPAQGRDINVASSNAKSPSANGRGGSRGAQRSVLDYMPEGDNDDVTPILWPTSTPSSRIEDRASLFIGFVYSLSSPRRTEQTRLLTHLSREVHPSLPSSIFPEMFASMRATQRGSMHDMYAWRVLKLKRGRDGLSGPGDWEIDQGCEDDGEKAGGRAVLRAIEKTGASDVLVIVSRWYGGTMLGPIRFEHIENCATEALRQFLDDEALVPLRKQLGDLDSEVLNLRARSSTSSSQTATPSTLAATASPTSRKVAPTYADLTKEKAERLISARRKQVEMLKRKLSQGSSTNPSPANLDNLDAAQRALAVLPP